MGLKEFVEAVTNINKNERNADLERKELERVAKGGNPTIYSLANLAIERAKMSPDPTDAKIAHATPAERLIPQARARARMQLRSRP